MISHPSSPPSQRRTSLAAVLTSAVASGMTIGMATPLVALTMAAAGHGGFVVGLNAAAQALTVLVIGPFVPGVVKRIGPVPALLGGLLLARRGARSFPVAAVARGVVRAADHPGIGRRVRLDRQRDLDQQPRGRPSAGPDRGTLRNALGRWGRGRAVIADRDRYRRDAAVSGRRRAAGCGLPAGAGGPPAWHRQWPSGPRRPASWRCCRRRRWR